MKVENLLSVKSRREWREWLAKNGTVEKFCWINIGRGISYLDAVEDALCFGWIDSTKKQGLQRFSPRAKNSAWTELNRARAHRLEGLGLMSDEGRKCLPDRAFEILPEILNILKEDKELYDNFCNMPELYRRVRLDNIQSCLGRKQPELFKARLKKFIENTKANKMFGPWHDNGRLLG